MQRTSYFFRKSFRACSGILALSLLLTSFFTHHVGLHAHAATITAATFEVLEKAFEAALAGETIKYENAVSGTKFEQGNTIALRKKALTLQGIGGNFSLLNSLTNDIRNWVGVPENLDTQIDEAILAAQANLTTITAPSELTAPLFSSAGGVGNDFSINNIAISTIKVKYTSNVQGGGIIGVYSAANAATIGNISASIFEGNSIKADTLIQGGGIIGVTSSTGTATIGNISETSISGNTISASNELWGGLVYAQNSTVDGIRISNSSFTGNTATTTTNTGKGGAMLSFDTSMGAATQAVNISATDGKTTRFKNNTINGVANSLYFGDIQGTGGSLVDAVLSINTEAGSTVALYDPISVNMNTADNTDKTFTMNVAGLGTFMWGGANTIKMGGVASEIYFGSNSNTILAPDFSLHSDPSDGNIHIEFDNASTITMDVSQLITPTNPSRNPLFSGDIDIAILVIC